MRPPHDQKSPIFLCINYSALSPSALSVLNPDITAIILRLYGIGKVRDRLIGEAFLHFSDVQLLQQKQLTGKEPNENVLWNIQSRKMFAKIELPNVRIKYLSNFGDGTKGIS